MKRKVLALLAGCVFFAVSAEAEELRLKTRTIDPNREDGGKLKSNSSQSNPRSLSGNRWRWLVQFDNSEPDFTVWEQRGAKVLSTVPVNGFIISAPDAMSWQDLSFTYRAPILASDKVSTLIAAEASRAAESNNAPQLSLVIVHFHSDVQPWEADGILAAEGMEQIENGSLEPADRLVEISEAGMTALSLWDEVEFIFPAPEGMKLGEAYLSCGGILSSGYEIAMLAASYGEGWDGPGRGRASISYSFGGLGSRTDPAATKAEIRRALAQWSKVVAVEFAESQIRTATRNLDIMFATGSHGDPYPFLSGTTVLAHSFYPANPNPEPVAGDIHINDAWSWSLGGQWDVYSVVLHELGHSLGIGHTDAPGSVMYPYYQKATELQQPDIDSIRQIYADATSGEPSLLAVTIASPAEKATVSTTSANLSGSVLNGAAGLIISYRNEANSKTGSCQTNSTYTTYSCPAIPLSEGLNPLLVEAVLGEQRAIAQREVRREITGSVDLKISSPAGNGRRTTASEVRIAGTATHPDGIAKITWATNHGKSGAANGLESWSAVIPLSIGSNEITVTAVARTGIVSARKVTIERTELQTPTTPNNPGDDKVPPRMTIQQPIGNFIITSAAKLTFRGTATDNVSVKQVTWTNSAGQQSGTANANAGGGSVNWSFDVNIAVGFNSIQVRAWDTSGNSTLYSTTVRRY